MRKLSYKIVYKKYKESFSEHTASAFYKVYKSFRFRFEKMIPIKEYDTIKNDTNELDEESSDIPLGFNYLSNQNETGYVELSYIDFYDFLPKETTYIFKKELFKIISKYGISKYDFVKEEELKEQIHNMERYFDHKAFTKLCTINLSKNHTISPFSSRLSIEISNLSFSFSVVRYRFFITKEFNQKLSAILLNKFAPYAKPFRLINVPWYKPNHYGIAFYSGNSKRQQEFYRLITNLKWSLFSALKKQITVYFDREHLFPPSFITFTTNIRPSQKFRESDFWDSIMLNHDTDYSIKYNSCICFNDYEQYEGISLSAYCGGGFSKGDITAELAKIDIGNIYGTYMVANCLNRIATREIEQSNKAISRAISQAKLKGISKNP